MKNIKHEFNKPETLEEYFIIIGVDPRISLNNFLYCTNIEELNTFFIKDEITPKILSKFPPIKKSYINIHSSIIDLCFPNAKRLPLQALDPEILEPAYALSIHKSQGSEYRHCAIVLDSLSEKILSRELIYTAMSRAQVSFSLYAEEATVLEAIAHPTQRTTGLADCLSSVLLSNIQN